MLVLLEVLLPVVVVAAAVDYHAGEALDDYFFRLPMLFRDGLLDLPACTLPPW